MILNCSHGISSYDTIQWYQQAHGDTSLKLIGYARYSTTKEIEKEYKDHFNITGDGRSSASLYILKARQVEDSAAYFCAASYAQCYTCPHTITKKDLITLFTCLTTGVPPNRHSPHITVLHYQYSHTLYAFNIIQCSSGS